MIENEIHLNDDERRRLVELLHAKAGELFPEQPAEAFHADILRAWRPAFLNDPFFLFHTDVSADDTVFTLCFLSAEGESESAVFQMLDENGHLQFSAAGEVAGSPALVLDAATAVSYFRCCLTGAISPAIMIESPCDLTLYDPVRYNAAVPSDQKKVVFYTPLESPEMDRITRALEEHPVRVIETGESFLILEVCVLYDDSLIFGSYKLHTVDQPVSFGITNPKKAGQIESMGPGITLVSGLPRNYCLSNFSMPGQYFARAKKTDPECGNVPPREQELILRDISRILLPFIIKPSFFRRKYLRLFQRDLLSIEADIHGENERIDLIWKPGHAVALDGTSSPIHDFHDALMHETGRSFFIGSAEDAIDYTRFFCDNVWGDEGPFTVVEPGDPLLDRLTEDNVTLGEEVESLDALRSRIAPLQAEFSRNEDGNFYKVSAYVSFNTMIFESVLAVSETGQIEMLEDQFLAGVHDLKIPAKPFGGFTPAIPADHLEPLDAGSLSGPAAVNKLIIGRFQLRDTAIREFRSCRFRGEVDLKDFSKDGGLLIENCVFEGGLTAKGARFGGTFEISSSSVIPANGAEQETDMARLACGDLIMSGFAVRGSLSLSSVSAQRICFSRITLTEDLDLTFGLIEQYAWIKGLSVRGNLDLFGTVVTHNHLSISGPLRIDGNFDAAFLKAGTGIVIDSGGSKDSSIKGNADFTNAVAPSALRIHGVDIDGGIRAKYLTAGSVRILGSKIRFSDDFDSEDGSESERPAPDPMRVGKGLDFSFAKIENDAWFLDIEATDDDRPDTPSLSLRSAAVGHNLRIFASAETIRSMDVIIADGLMCAAELPGGIDLAQAKIGGEADLSCVQCSAGLVTFNDAELAHDLLIRSSGDRTARALRLEMDNFICRGTADITGLELVKTDSPDRKNPPSGVSARFSRFEKKLITASIDEAMKEKKAVIPGLLDLTGSDICELSISSKSFTAAAPGRGPAEQSSGIILNRARIDKLTSVIIGRQYPRPIDLRYAEIKWWNFLKAGVSSSGTAADFIELLRGDTHLQRHTFRSIERNLIEQGNEDTADAIHKEMRKWIRRQLLRPRSGRRIRPGRKVKAFFLWLWDSATGSATTPFRLLAVVILWFVLSTVFFSFPENLVPSTPALIADKDMRPSQHPAASWKGMAPFWISVRYHIPVATFTAQSGWDPSGEGSLVVWKRGSGEKTKCIRLRWITAEDYANIVTSCHWLLWPVILILASRKFFRHFEK